MKLFVYLAVVSLHLAMPALSQHKITITPVSALSPAPVGSVERSLIAAPIQVDVESEPAERPGASGGWCMMDLGDNVTAD